MRFFVAALLVAGVCGAQAELGSLTGSVRDLTGTAVSKTLATLRLDTDPETQLRTQTDQNGVFRFDSLAPGKYTLRLEQLGFKRVSIESITVSMSQRTTLPPFVPDVANIDCSGPMLPSTFTYLPNSTKGTGNIVGSISTDRKASLARGTATLHCEGNRVCAETKTDAKGGFQFTNLSAGNYGISLKLPGFYPEVLQVRVREGFEAVYGQVVLDPCGGANCGPARRTKPKTGYCD